MSEIAINRKIQHLYWRAGFGPDYTILKSGALSLQNETEKVFSQSLNIESLKVVAEDRLAKEGRMAMTETEKKMYNRQLKQKVVDLNQQWFQMMADSAACLNEKMTLFWAGHFACRITRPYQAQQFLNVLRKNALGKFSELLSAISITPAMLVFLNNVSNKKQQPNENFAREVMELFTLGRGNYTEEDVKEAARAFTGWSLDKEGNFIFRKGIHDEGTKTFLGKTGNYSGEDILKIILEKKQCAKFLTEKIYRFFVNDIPDATLINSLADEFYNSGYDIKRLMKNIFTSTWFYDEKNIGQKIKSPMVFLVNLTKNFRIQFLNKQNYLGPQKILGQVLFRPPNVAGWPDGRSWIDSSTLMYRLRMPMVLLSGAEEIIQPKSEFDAMVKKEENDGDDMMNAKSLYRKLKINSNWSEFIHAFALVNESELPDKLASFLLQTDVNKLDRSMVEKYSGGADKNEKIKSLALHLMSLPEYQMC